MAIEIDYTLCTRCGICIDSCMMDVIRRDGDEVSLVYPEDCQDCFLCVKDCPEGAVKIHTR
jgi:NAD-dependent dihydropyrimidine dehydrogenase PreA subunit